MELTQENLSTNNESKSNPENKHLSNNYRKQPVGFLPFFRNREWGAKNKVGSYKHLMTTFDIPVDELTISLERKSMENIVRRHIEEANIFKRFIKDPLYSLLGSRLYWINFLFNLKKSPVIYRGEQGVELLKLLLPTENEFKEFYESDIFNYTMKSLYRSNNTKVLDYICDRLPKTLPRLKEELKESMTPYKKDKVRDGLLSLQNNDSQALTDKAFTDFEEIKDFIGQSTTEDCFDLLTWAIQYGDTTSVTLVQNVLKIILPKIVQVNGDDLITDLVDNLKYYASLGLHKVFDQIFNSLNPQIKRSVKLKLIDTLIPTSIKSGEIEMVKLAEKTLGGLINKLDIVHDVFSSPILDYAAESGNLEIWHESLRIIEAMIKDNSRRQLILKTLLTKQNNQGRILLHHAVLSRNLDLLKAIIQFYKENNLFDDLWMTHDTFGFTAIDYAIKSGDLTAFDTLLDSLDETNQKTYKESYKINPSFIRLAAQSNSSDMFQKIWQLAEGNITLLCIPDERGLLPLAIAAEFRSHVLFEEILNIMKGAFEKARVFRNFKIANEISNALRNSQNLNRLRILGYILSNGTTELLLDFLSFFDNPLSSLRYDNNHSSIYLQTEDLEKFLRELSACYINASSPDSFKTLLSFLNILIDYVNSAGLGITSKECFQLLVRRDYLHQLFKEISPKNLESLKETVEMLTPKYLDYFLYENNDGLTFIDYIIQYNCKPLLTFFEIFSRNNPQNDFWTSEDVNSHFLISSVESGDLKIFETVWNFCGRNINLLCAPNKAGITPLTQAIKAGNKALFSRILNEMKMGYENAKLQQDDEIKKQILETLRILGSDPWTESYSKVMESILRYEDIDMLAEFLNFFHNQDFHFWHNEVTNYDEFLSPYQIANYENIWRIVFPLNDLKIFLTLWEDISRYLDPNDHFEFLINLLKTYNSDSIEIHYSPSIFRSQGEQALHNGQDAQSNPGLTKSDFANIALASAVLAKTEREIVEEMVSRGMLFVQDIDALFSRGNNEETSISQRPGNR